MQLNDSHKQTYTSYSTTVCQSHTRVISVQFNCSCAELAYMYMYLSVARSAVWWPVVACVPCRPTSQRLPGSSVRGLAASCLQGSGSVLSAGVRQCLVCRGLAASCLQGSGRVLFAGVWQRLVCRGLEGRGLEGLSCRRLGGVQAWG